MCVPGKREDPQGTPKRALGVQCLRAVSGDGAQLRRWVQQGHDTPAGGRSKPGRFDKVEEESAACTTAGPRSPHPLISDVKGLLKSWIAEVTVVL